MTSLFLASERAGERERKREVYKKREEGGMRGREGM